MKPITLGICSVFMSLISSSWYLEAKAFSFAETGYTLLNGDCPKSAPSKKQNFAELHCSPQDPHQLQKLLSQDFGVISEDAFLAALAEERHEAMTCTRDQIANLLQKPEEKKIFVQDLTEKLLTLLEEKKKMASLTAALGQGAGKEEYKKARARIETILADIPFANLPSMQKTIAHITSQDDFILGGRVAPEIENYIKDAIEKSLPVMKNETSQGLDGLKNGILSLGHSFSDAERESLAQDSDLIESFRQKNKKLEPTLKSVACRVDSKFGKGAERRDQALLVTSVLGSALGAGLPMTLATRGRFAAQVTGAAAKGSISFRSAGILRAGSLAIDSAFLAREVQRICFNGVSNQKGHVADREKSCETSVVTELENNRCLLTTVMGLLGAPGLFRDFKGTLSMVKGTKPVNSSAVRIQTPAGWLDEDKNHFVKFQELIRSGRVQEAEALNRRVRQTMQKGKMTVIGDIEDFQNGGGKFVRLSDGSLGVWKPEKMKAGRYKGWFSSQYEVAAYKVDHYLGLHRVPPTIEREMNGEKGSLQLMVGGLKNKFQKDFPEESVLFDYLIANFDRHGENYLLTHKGSMIGIDHGVAFRPGSVEAGEFKHQIDFLFRMEKNDTDENVANSISKYRKMNPGQALSIEKIREIREAETKVVRAKTVQEMSALIGEKESYLRLKDTTDSEFRTLLKDHLKDTEIQGFLNRRKEIVDAVEEARQKLGDDIFRSGPASPVREIHIELEDPLDDSFFRM